MELRRALLPRQPVELGLKLRGCTRAVLGAARDDDLRKLVPAAVRERQARHRIDRGRGERLHLDVHRIDRAVARLGREEQPGERAGQRGADLFRCLSEQPHAERGSGERLGRGDALLQLLKLEIELGRAPVHRL